MHEPLGPSTKPKSGKYEPEETSVIWSLATYLRLDRRDLYDAIYEATNRRTSRTAVQDTFSKAFSESPRRKGTLTPKNRAFFGDALATIFRNQRKQIDRVDIDAFVQHPTAALLEKFKAAPDLPAEPAQITEVSAALEARWTRNCYFEVSRLQGQYHLSMDTCLDWGLDRFRKHSNDVFLLAILAWNIFGRGNGQRIRALAPLLATFLDPRPGEKTVFDFPAWTSALEALRDGSMTHDDSMFLRRHLDDALARSAILTYLREEGRQSWLANRIRNAARLSQPPHQVARIFEVLDGNSGILNAIATANNWCNVDTTSATARINLLWLLGRNENPDSIRFALERVTRWLEQHPRHDDAAVRWATIWLAGMTDHHVETVLAQTREWLVSEQAEDDRVVRLSYFWLVGEKGIRGDVDTAFADAKVWFRDKYRNDRVTRIGYLIWLVTRTYIRGFITKEKFTSELDSYRKWADAGRHDGIVTAALTLASSLEYSPLP